MWRNNYRSGHSELCGKIDVACLEIITDQDDLKFLEETK